MTIWLGYNDETLATNDSVAIYNFCKVSPGFDHNLVGSPSLINGLYWFEIPDDVPLDSTGHVEVSEDSPEDIPVIQTEEMLLGIFDDFQSIMQDFMVENTLNDISSADAKALADGMKDLWYYSQTVPTAAIGELDRLLALPIGSRIAGLVDTSFVSDNRLNEIKAEMVSVIFPA